MRNVFKFFTLIIMACLAFVMVGCGDDTPEIDAAKVLAESGSYVFNLYESKAGAKTDSFDVVNTVMNGQNAVKVTWELKVEGSQEAVQLQVKEGSFSTVYVGYYDGKVSEPTTFTLEPSLEIAGVSKKLSELIGNKGILHYSVDQFVLGNRAAWEALTGDHKDDLINLKGVVLDVLQSGSSQGSFYFQDADGYGYYAYKPVGAYSGSGENIKWNVKAGDVVVVSGKRSDYSGQQEFGQGCTFHVYKGETLAINPLNASADWAAAASNKTFDQKYQNNYVKLENCTPLSSDGSYYYFTVGDGKAQYNIYDSYYFLTEDQRNAFKAAWAQAIEKGATINIEGIATVYSSAIQVYGSTHFPTIFTENAPLSAEEKLAKAKVALELAQDQFTKKGEELALPPKGFGGVDVSWASSSENLVVEEGKLVVKNLVDEEVTLTATLSIDGKTETKEFKVTMIAKIDWLTAEAAAQEALKLDGDNKEVSTELTYIFGVVTDDPTATYCNFHLGDLYVYGLWNEDGSKAYGSKKDIAELPLAKGDTVYLVGYLQNYNGTPELTKARFLPAPEKGSSIANPYTGEEVLALIMARTNNDVSEEKVYVKAVVNEITNTQYCNFTLIDGASNTVLAYGLYNAEGKRFGSKRDIAEIPFKAGDTLVLLTNLQKYAKGETITPELVNAVLCEIIPAGGTEPQVQTPVHAGTEADPYDVADACLVASALEGDAKSEEVYVKGIVSTSKYEEGKNYTIWLKNGNTESAFELYHVTLAEGITGDLTAVDALKGYEVVCKGQISKFNTTLEINGGVVVSATAPANPPATPTADDAPILGKGDNASDAKVIIGGVENDAIKVGTGKAGGSMTIKVKAGTTKIQFYVVSWKGKPTNISVTGATVDQATLSPAADDGISNNSPFTLSGDASTFLVTLTLSGVEAETTITLSSVVEGNADNARRFVVWGASYSE